MSASGLLGQFGRGSELSGFSGEADVRRTCSERLTLSGHGAFNVKPFGSLRLSRRTDLRCTNGLCDAEEDDHPFAGAAGRNGFSGLAVADVVILPVVGHPNIAGRADADVDLQLQPTADIAARRRDRIAGLHAGRAGLGAEATEMHDFGAELVKFDIQMLSFPSTETAQGPEMPLP